MKWGYISYKYIVKRKDLSQIKAWSFWLVENLFFPLNTQQAISGTSAATYKLTTVLNARWTILGMSLFFANYVLINLGLLQAAPLSIKKINIVAPLRGTCIRAHQ